MAELDDGWLNLSADSGVNVDVENLDFAFVEACVDWKQLYKVLALLRSGKEGHYPDLERAAEAKLLVCMPEKIKRRYLAVKCSATPAQIAEAESGVAAWLAQAVHLDNRLKAKQLDTNGSGSGSSETGVHWTLLLCLSKSQAGKISKLKAELKVDALSVLQLERNADMERRKGNECFRALDYPAALLHYSRSLAFLDNNAVVWANRAMVYIKTEAFDLAEVDCSIALALDEGHKKARSRRGLVRFKQGKLRLAVEDFCSALKPPHDPNDAEIQQMLRKALDKFREVEGYDLVLSAAPDASSPVPIPVIEVRQLGTGQPVTVSSFHQSSRQLLFLPHGQMHLRCAGELQQASAQPSSSSGFVRISIEVEDNNDDDDEEDSSGEQSTLLAALPADVRAEVDTLLTSSDDRKHLAHALKDIGNGLVRNQRDFVAVGVYSLSLVMDYSTVTLNNRAQAHLNCQQYAAAVDDCNAVLAAEVGNSKARYRRARAYFAADDVMRCLEDVQYILSTDPTNAAALQLQLEAQSARGVLSEKLKLLGNKCLEAGDVVGAIDLYTQCVQADSNNFAALNNRAVAYTRAEDFGKAECDLNTVLANCMEGGVRQKALFRRATLRYRTHIDHANPTSHLRAAMDDLNSLEEDTQQSEARESLRQQIVEAIAATSPNESAVSPPRSPVSARIVRASVAVPSIKSTKFIKVPDDPPRSLYEFERVWRSLSSDEGGQQAQLYLSKFKTSTFKKVFKDAIATELLGSVFRALKSCTQPSLLVKVLTGLAQLGTALAFALAMLPADDSSALQGIFQYLRVSAEVPRGKLAELCKAFNVE